MGDDQLEKLAYQFSQLAPDDQEWVLALAARLRGDQPDPDPAVHRDVSFMDFED